MKKLNNKGLSVIELVITFAILMVLVVGMLNVVVDIKNTTTDKALEKKIVEFRSTLTQVIQDDLIKKKANNVVNCTAFTATKKAPCKKIMFEDGTSAELIVRLDSCVITYKGINYEIPDKSIMEFRDSGVWANNTDEERLKNNVRIEKDSNNFINIYIPYYTIDEYKNHGIDIVHPIGL